MGVLTLDSYIRNTYPKAIRKYDKGQKLPGKFACLGLDANPFVYSAVYRVFEMGPCKTLFPRNANKSYERKVQMVYEDTWNQIESIVNVVTTDEVYIAFDGSAPRSKECQQLTRRYVRSMPEEGDFDISNISTGTKFLHDLCTFIKHKIHEVQWPRVIFSSQNVPGEGEHKIMDHFRTYPMGTKVCMFGPDGDLIMLGLSSNLDFHLFKVDHKTEHTGNPKYYTIHINTIKKELSGGKFDTNKIDSFVFLGFLLGNDFVPRLEMFHLFFDGIVNLYKYVNDDIIVRKKLDRGVFKDLLTKLSNDEPLLMSKRTEYPFPLLEKYKDGDKFDFPGFRKEYYKEWLNLEDEKDIRRMAYRYLDTLWWNWIYYTRGCPTFNHSYGYHYPPFACDLLSVIDKWVIPEFTKVAPRLPFQQLCAVMPPNRKHLLPKKYHKFFEDCVDPSSIKKNIEGRHEEFEAVYEVPMEEKEINVEHKHYHARNRVDKDRLFVKGEELYEYETKWGKIDTYVEG